MFKKSFTIILALILVVSLLAGCAGKGKDTQKDNEGNDNVSQNEQGDEKGTDEPEPRTLLTITAAGQANDGRKFWTNEGIANFIKDEFGIVFEYDWLSADKNEYREQLTVFFAANNNPDYILETHSANTTIKLGMEGRLVPINQHIDKLPNYRALFTDADWEFMISENMDEEQNMYFVSGKGDELTSSSNIILYRKSAFDRIGVTWPETMDELVEVLRIVKQETGVAPGIVTGSSNQEDKLPQRLFAPSFRLRRSYMLDPDNDYKMVFGPSTDKYRDALRASRLLLEEGLFLPLTYAEGDALIETGQVYVLAGSPNGVRDLEDKMRHVEPDVEWAIGYYVEGYPGKTPTIDPQEPYTGNGPMIATSMSEEKLDRVLEFIDWMCTKEGRIWQNYGLENVSFTYEDGKVKWMPNIKHPIQNPDGVDDYREVAYGAFLASVPSDWTVYEDTPLEDFNKNIVSNYEFIQHIRTIATPEEKQAINDITEPVRLIMKDYTLAYLRGELDESSWDEYIENMKRAGLEEATEIMQTTYDKTKDIQAN